MQHVAEPGKGVLRSVVAWLHQGSGTPLFSVCIQGLVSKAQSCSRRVKCITALKDAVLCACVVYQKSRFSPGTQSCENLAEFICVRGVIGIIQLLLPGVEFVDMTGILLTLS